MRTERHLLTTLLPAMCGFSRRECNDMRKKIFYADNLTFSGVPHSIQALDDGVEFLLVFDDGDFSEDNTFLATEVFLHTPVRKAILN